MWKRAPLAATSRCVQGPSSRTTEAGCAEGVAGSVMTTSVPQPRWPRAPGPPAPVSQPGPDADAAWPSAGRPPSPSPRRRPSAGPCSSWPSWRTKTPISASTRAIRTFAAKDSRKQIARSSCSRSGSRTRGRSSASAGRTPAAAPATVKAPPLVAPRLTSCLQLSLRQCDLVVHQRRHLGRRRREQLADAAFGADRAAVGCAHRCLPRSDGSVFCLTAYGSVFCTVPSDHAGRCSSSPAPPATSASVWRAAAFSSAIRRCSAALRSWMAAIRRWYSGSSSS